MNILAEFAPILLSIVALILGAIMIPVGIVYTFLKPVYDYRKKGFKTIVKRFGMWWLKVMYQVWNVVKYGFMQIAYIVDLLGNVLVGELIEDVVTAEEDTWFGNGGISISAALGKLEFENKLNGRGLFFSKVLASFEADHCVRAYKYYVMRIELDEKLKAEAEAKAKK